MAPPRPASANPPRLAKVAFQSQLALDNRWVGDLWSAVAGIELDAASEVTGARSWRIDPGARLGLGVDLETIDMWLTARLGYRFATMSSRSISYRIGLGVVVPF